MIANLGNLSPARNCQSFEEDRVHATRHKWAGSRCILLIAEAVTLTATFTIRDRRDQSVTQSQRPAACMIIFPRAHAEKPQCG